MRVYLDPVNLLFWIGLLAAAVLGYVPWWFVIAISAYSVSLKIRVK